MWSAVREVISLFAALTPGALATWDGRRLIRRLDDPAFPELKLARAGRLVAVAVGCLLASVLVSPAFAMLKTLLLALALMAGTFPLRRAMFRERWSLWRYGAFAIRFWVALLGTWILLALIPTVLDWAGPFASVAAAAIAAVLLAWALWYRQAFVWMIGARPLEAGALHDDLEVILDRAAGPCPSIRVASARGGHWVNAFAVPSLGRPAVVFTRDLLRLLDPRETAAIFAHEVAHLEHYTRRRVALRLGLLAALVALILAVLLVARREPAVAAAASWIWPLACLVALAAVLGRSQAHERESDLRALALSGDPDALITALTKIHHAMRLPRRWARGGERHQTHPSLARRIRSIRDAAAERGLAVASAPVSTTLLRAADEPTTVVVFGTDRMHWLRGVPADAPADLDAALRAAAEQRSIRYTELADLRLEVHGMERRVLAATDAGGAPIRVAIHAADVPAVKHNLERIDLEVRETSHAGDTLPGRAAARTGRITAAIGILFGVLPPFSLPFLAAMVMALIRPARAALTAAGATAFAVALIGLRDTGNAWVVGLPPVVHALLGLLFLIEARKTRPDDGRFWLKVAAVLGAAGGVSLIAAGPRLQMSLPLMQLHTWARHDAAIVAALLGLAAVMVTTRRPRARLYASGAVLTAALVGAVGSTWFRDHLADDPLAVTQPRLAPSPLAAQLARTAEVPGYVDALRLSSGGRWAAREAVRDPGKPARFHVEQAEGDHSTVEAWDAAFIGHERLATIEATAGGSFLKLRRLDRDLSVETEIRLPELSHPSLRAGVEWWELVSTDLQESRGVRLRGDWRSPTFDRETWQIHDADGVYLAELTVGSGGALAVRGRFDVAASGPFSALAFFTGWPVVTELASVTSTATTPFALTTAQIVCADPPAGSARLVCSGTGIDRDTRLWTVDPAVGDLATVGAIRGFFHAVTHVSPTQALLLGVGGGAVVVDLDEGRAWELQPSDAPTALAQAGGTVGWDWLFESRAVGPIVQAAALVGETAVIATGDGDVTRVAVYRLPGG